MDHRLKIFIQHHSTCDDRVMVAEDTDQREQPEPPARDGWWSKRFNRALVVAAGAYVVVGSLSLFLIPEALLSNWLPGSSEADRAKLIGVAAQLVLIGLGGVIAVVGVTLSVARHREELETQRRDRERLGDDRAKESARRSEWEDQRRTDAEREFRARFVTTVNLLSDQSSIKRTAALYAIGALADDWTAFGRADEAQVCINVLCGYLKAPSPDNQANTANERAVRQTGFDIIGSHLKNGEWGNREIDLSGATIDVPVSLKGAKIGEKGIVSFSGAHVKSHVSLDEAVISGGRVNFVGVTIGDEYSSVSFRRADITDSSLVLFSLATVSGHGRVSFHGAKIRNSATISLDDIKIVRRGAVEFDASTVIDDGGIRIGQGAVDGYLSFARLKVGTRGLILLRRVKISEDSVVSFRGTKVDVAASIILDGAEIRSMTRIQIDGATSSDEGPVILPDGQRIIPAPVEG